MNYEDLLTAEPTRTPNNSLLLFRDVMLQGWRIYSSDTTPDHERWVSRFLQSHARTPGIFTEQMLAITPIDTLFFTSEDDYRIVGSLFMNGAVFTVFPPNQPATVLLLVSEDTAERWHYLSEGYRQENKPNATTE